MPSRLTDEEIANIKDLHMHAKGTIQDYARIYRVSVDEILGIIGEEGLGTVHVGGDLIDEAEMGPQGRGQISQGEDVAVPFTTN